MTQFISNLLTLGIAVTLILLAVESDSVLQWFGYGYGVLIFVAALLNWNRADKSKRTP
jgi:hypothetical protein